MRDLLKFYARSADVLLLGSKEELNNLGLSTPVVRIGWPDQVIEHGNPETLRSYAGITAAAAVEKLQPFLKTTLLELYRRRPQAPVNGIAEGSERKFDVS